MSQRRLEGKLKDAGPRDCQEALDCLSGNQFFTAAHAQIVQDNLDKALSRLGLGSGPADSLFAPGGVLSDPNDNHKAGPESPAVSPYPHATSRRSRVRAQRRAADEQEETVSDSLLDIFSDKEIEELGKAWGMAEGELLHDARNAPRTKVATPEERRQAMLELDERHEELRASNQTSRSG